MNRIKSFSMGLLCAAGITTAALAGHYDSALDERGQMVTDMRGNCVLTKWDSNHGCNGRIALSNAERMIYFDFDSAALTPQAKAKLDRIAGAVKRAGTVISADIIGHADKIGNPQYNVRLSERRANAVKDYLASRGYVDTRVTTTSGKGESQPVTTGCGGDKQCLQPDRRVEINLNYVGGYSNDYYGTDDGYHKFFHKNAGRNSSSITR